MHTGISLKENSRLKSCDICVANLSGSTYNHNKYTINCSVCSTGMQISAANHGNFK